MFVYVCHCVVIGNYVFVLYIRINFQKKTETSLTSFKHDDINILYIVYYYLINRHTTS